MSFRNPFVVSVAVALIAMAGALYVGYARQGDPAALSGLVETEHFEGDFALEGFDPFSALGRELSAEAQARLDALAIEADADIAGLIANGFEAQRWSHSETWTALSSYRGRVAVVGAISTMTGGAHPNLTFETGLYLETGEPFEASTLFSDFASAEPILKQSLCEATVEEKTNRQGDAFIYDQALICDEAGRDLVWTSADLTFAASDAPPAFGGLIAYFEPYVLGPYSEGAYVAVIDQSVFFETLTDEGKSLFAGKAVRDAAWD